MNEKHFTLPFTQNIPSKLVENGDGKQKPLIIYLHGYKQNMQLFEKHISELLKLPACHLLLQGPYPIYDERRKHRVEDWGRAWYLYDGNQKQFKKSMEESSKYIDRAINKISDSISYSTVAVLGYSMGGYLAGYYALSRPQTVDHLVVMGSRIKSEWFEGKSYEGLDVLALHGLQDKSVDVAAAEKSSLELQNMGASVTFKTLNEGHRLTGAYISEVKEWMKVKSVVSG